MPTTTNLINILTSEIFSYWGSCMFEYGQFERMWNMLLEECGTCHMPTTTNLINILTSENFSYWGSCMFEYGQFERMLNMLLEECGTCHMPTTTNVINILTSENFSYWGCCMFECGQFERMRNMLLEWSLPLNCLAKCIMCHDPYRVVMDKQLAKACLGWKTLKDEYILLLSGKTS